MGASSNFFKRILTGGTRRGAAAAGDNSSNPDKSVSDKASISESTTPSSERSHPSDCKDNSSSVRHTHKTYIIITVSSWPLLEPTFLCFLGLLLQSLLHAAPVVMLLSICVCQIVSEYLTRKINICHGCRESSWWASKGDHMKGESIRLDGHCGSKEWTMASTVMTERSSSASQITARNSRGNHITTTSRWYWMMPVLKSHLPLPMLCSWLIGLPFAFKLHSEDSWSALSLSLCAQA